jgi:peptidoglycan/LPS O-acetylase OafA/YrhL
VPRLERVRSLGHVPALDGLRGIAILLVLGQHAHVIAAGAFGVDLFFVLSGFLITSLLLNEHGATGTISLRAFYRRRALRLLPALIVLLTAYIAVTANVVDAALSLGYVANLATLHGHDMGDLAHMWSLAQEEQFYLLWPLALVVALLLKLAPARLTAALAGMFVAVVVYRLGSKEGWHALWFSPFTHADGLLLGCIAGFAFTQNLLRSIPRAVLFCAVAVAGACVVFVDLDTARTAQLALPLFSLLDTARTAQLALPLFSLAAMIVVLGVVLSQGWWFTRAIDQRPLRYIGRISYGLYLWHWPLYVAFGWKIGAPLAVAVAALSFRFVEKPFLRRRNRGQRDVALPQPQVATAT